MSEPFLGELKLISWNFPPKGWAFCNGQFLPINQNQALFSILGTTYGGNGQTTFGLPDLRGRTPVGQGQGPGISNYTLGQITGTEGTAITAVNLPPHNHAVSGTIKMLTTTAAANALTPGGNYFANDGSTRYNTTNGGGTMKPANISAL